MQEKNIEEKDFSSDEDHLHVFEEKKERLTALLQVNDCNVRFQLDTGADVNTICKRYVKREQVIPCLCKLTMWNETTIKPAGETVSNV